MVQGCPGFGSPACRSGEGPARREIAARGESDRPMDIAGAKELSRRLAQQEHWRQARAVRIGRQPSFDPDGHALRALPFPVCATTGNGVSSSCAKARGRSSYAVIANASSRASGRTRSRSKQYSAPPDRGPERGLSRADRRAARRQRPAGVSQRLAVTMPLRSIVTGPGFDAATVQTVKR